MLQSVISRLAFFSALALMALAVPIFYLMSAEASPLNATPVKAASLQSDTTVSTLTDTPAEEAPAVKLASLTLTSTKPSLEILEPFGSPESEMVTRLERASELAKDQRFDEALSTLDGVHMSKKDEYAVKFLEARILAWAGHHKQAEKAFRGLSAQYPQNLDVMVSFGYLQFYQRNYTASEKLFVEVLRLNPDYMDARRGLERARQAKKKI